MSTGGGTRHPQRSETDELRGTIASLRIRVQTLQAQCDEERRKKLEAYEDYYFAQSTFLKMAAELLTGRDAEILAKINETQAALEAWWASVEPRVTAMKARDAAADSC